MGAGNVSLVATPYELDQDAWQRYALATRGPDFAEWAAEHCVQAIDEFEGLPLVLEPWQLAIVNEALAELAEDEVYWRTLVLVIPRKNGKTSLLSAVGLYHLVTDRGSPEILMCAASDKQAGRLFKAAASFVRSDPWLSAQLLVRDHEGEIARVDGRGTMYRVSADSGAVSGFNPSLIVADELADWRTPRRMRSWAALATGGMARRLTRTVAISTAGEPAERAEGVLGSMIDKNEREGDLERAHRALTVSRNHKARTLIYNYDARTREPTDLEAIKAANPASWITEERLVETAANPALTPGRFLQLHGCVWVASEGEFLDLEQWRRLARPGERLVAREELVLGFRGGDGGALVAARRSDGLLSLLGHWDDLETEDADDLFDATMRDFRVAQVYSSHSPAWATMVDGWRHRLGRRKVVDVDVSKPSPGTAAVTERFRADAKAGSLTHDGDPVLEAHILAAHIARARNLPYLVSDVRRGAPIHGALAGLLAWEAHAVIGSSPTRTSWGFA